MFLNNADNIGYDNRASGLEAGNVQAAIDLLAGGKAVVKFTLPKVSSGTHAQHRVDYPMGFNAENTILIGARSFESGNSYWLNESDASAYFYDDRIVFYVKGSAILPKNFEAILMRTDV